MAGAGSHSAERQFQLTSRQREVLALMARGKTNFEIAQALGISLEGAKYHVSEILARLNVDSREEAVAAWREQRRPFARLGRMFAPLGAAGWVAAAAAGLALVAIAVFFVLTALEDDAPGQADVSPTAPAGTAVQEPETGVPESCPAAGARSVYPAFGPAAGDGPVYVAFRPPMEPGQRTFGYDADGPLDGFAEGWGGGEVMFIVAPDYREAITISATRLDSAGAIEFIGPDETVLLPPNGTQGTGFPVWSQAADGWRTYLAAVTFPLDADGCYALDFQGPGLAQRVVFWAEQQAAIPAPSADASSTPTPDAPDCGMVVGNVRPPIDWVPFVRVEGRQYLGPTWIGGLPWPAFGPSQAGNQVGVVAWNVNDEATDPCYSQLDGSSSVLPVGTRLYEMKGYRPSYRILAETPYGWQVFESDWNDGGANADELLDIRGKVVSVLVHERDMFRGEEGRTWSETEPDRVEALVDDLLTAPITFTPGPEGGPQPALEVTFSLQDGTITKRFWFAGPQPYSAGIPVSAAFIDEVKAWLAEE